MLGAKLTGKAMAGAKSMPMSAAAARDAAPLFAALGDSTRLLLLGRLSSGGPGSIAQLTAQAEVSRQAITKHLEILSEAGLVRSARQGRERIWELEPARLGAAHGYLESISKQWDAALMRLKEMVEEE